MGDDIARIFLALDLLSLGRHPPSPAPGTRSGLAEKLGEDPRWFPRFFLQTGRFLHLRIDAAPQPVVARKAQQVADAVVFAPLNQILPAETRVAADGDVHLRPGLPDLTDDPLHLLPASGRGVLIGRSQAPPSGRPQRWLRRDGAITSVLPRRYTAAGSSTGRSSHGRSALPDGRVEAGRSRPGPARSIPAVLVRF